MIASFDLWPARGAGLRVGPMPPRVARLSICALLLMPRLASAQEVEPGDTMVEAPEAARAAEAQDGSPTAEAPGEPGPLVWDPSLRRLRPWEYAIGPVLIAGAFTMYLALPDPDYDFSYGIRFDRVVQDAISVRSDTYRRIADVIGDVGFHGSMIYRGLEDIFVVGLARDGWPVASQLVGIDTMAFGLVGAVVWGSQVFIGRQRPSAYYCQTEPGYAEQFGGCTRYGANRSFLSGHFAAAVAGASLTCLYHDRFQIYRRPRAGRGACGATIAMAVLTGIARSTADGHWATDMVGGGALGFLAGWVLPRAVLFGFGDDDEVAPEPAPDGRAAQLSVRVQPFFDQTAGGLETRGRFSINPP